MLCPRSVTSERELVVVNELNKCPRGIVLFFFNRYQLYANIDSIVNANVDGFVLLYGLTSPFNRNAFMHTDIFYICTPSIFISKLLHINCFFHSVIVMWITQRGGSRKSMGCRPPAIFGRKLGHVFDPLKVAVFE